MRILKTEARSPWVLCPHPELWRAYDGESGEVEMFPFLTAMVHLIKPDVIVETGTHLADGSIALAKGCELNGFGHVWTYEIGTDQAELCRKRVESEGFSKYITVINDDARKVDWEGPPIELFFCDGGFERDKEILNFDPWFAPRCTIIAHDAASGQFGWDKLGEKYLPVILPTARGVWIMHKFAGTPINGNSK